MSVVVERLLNPIQNDGQGKEDSDPIPSLSLNRQVAPQPVQSSSPATWPPSSWLPFWWPLFSGWSSWRWPVGPLQLRPSFAPTDAVRHPELLFCQLCSVFVWASVLPEGQGRPA